MRNLDGIAVPGTIARLCRHGRDLRTAAAICRLDWVLCVAFDDVAAVEDAFEGAYRALTAAPDRTAQQFEAASSDLEKAYDAWLAATLAVAEGVPDGSPVWGRPSSGSVKSPYLVLRPNERTAE